ncbi:MAG: transporter permease/ATP-binding protein [Oscillospiraceae bacterium]|nr:transporter permease/ATP-binding protein [Oscillospiraceae bacterium]
MNNKLENDMRNLLKTSLEERGIKQEILSLEHCDMDLDCNFVDSMIAITESYLVFAVCESEDKSFYVSAKKFRKIKELYFYPIEEINRIFTTSLVCGGVFAIESEQEEKALCVYSNMKIRGIMKIIRLFDKLKKSQEITLSDLEDKDKPDFCPKCGMPYPEKGRQVCTKCMDKRSVFKRLLSYFYPYKLKIVGVLLCVFSNALLNILMPYLNGVIFYDHVLGKQQFLGIKSTWIILLMIVLTMVFVQILQQIFGIIQGRIVADVVPKVVLEIKTKVFASLQRLSIGFFSKRQTGGLMTRVNSDSNEVFGFFVDGVPFFAVNVVVTVTSVVVMFLLNWRLAIVSILLLPFLGVICYKLLPKLWHTHGRYHRSIRTLNSRINDNLVGARVVRAFGQGDNEIKRFEKVSSRVRDVEIDLVDCSNIFFSAYSSVQSFSSLLVWVIGSWLILSSLGMSYGTLITFVGYMGLLSGPIQFFTNLFEWWSKSANSAQRIFEIIDAVPEVKERKDPVILKQIEGEIEFKDVSFSYELNKPILKDISFKAERGKMLGIVGHTGTGKTTIVNLLSRLYDVSDGEVYLDGINVRDLNFAQLRKNIAMVSQETYIFQGTVAENIAYANPDCTREEIVTAAITANAHDFICKMQDGYDTMLGNGGKRLSGGEKQRISIARAILADPKILILDEATASVDTQTERNIQESLDRLSGGRTVIAIAHRLSTLKNADSLIVIENGQIVERGTHVELLEQKGVYYRLTQLQNKALAIRGL